MDEIMKLDLQWQALRYAVDMLDEAWSYHSSEYEGKHRDEKKIEMLAHRNMLLDMQTEVLNKKRELESR
jgi:hypothetical protein